MRAVSRGELSPDTDVASLTESIVGPIHYRAIVTGEPVDDAFIDAVAEDVLSVCHLRSTRQAAPPKKRPTPRARRSSVNVFKVAPRKEFSPGADWRASQ